MNPLLIPLLLAGAAFGQWGDAGGAGRGSIYIDGVAVTSTVAHHALHSGLFFSAVASADDIDAADTMFVYFKTDAIMAHYISVISTEFAGVVQFYEAPTLTDTAGMVNLAFYNHARDSDIENGMIAGWSESDAPAIDVSAANLGTLLNVFYIGSGGSGGKSIGGEGESSAEWMLAQETEYLIVFVSVSNNCHVAINLSYYLVDE